MKNINKFLLKKYSKMSGDKKIRLGMNLTKLVRTVRRAGTVATGV